MKYNLPRKLLNLNYSRDSSFLPSVHRLHYAFNILTPELPIICTFCRSTNSFFIVFQN